ncbi:hypothetical protein HDU99_010198, partial [Rhizoclosmatium hyalinum]
MSNFTADVQTITTLAKAQSVAGVLVAFGLQLGIALAVPTATPPPITTNMYDQVRCGASWIEANATCGLPCTWALDCPMNQLCYRDVYRCTNTPTRTFISLSDVASNATAVNVTVLAQSDLSSLTITQIDTKSKWYWLPVAITWIFSFVIYWALYNLVRLYIVHRKYYFTTSDFKDSIAHRTLLLSYIPADIDTNEKLVDLIHEKDANLHVQEATINRNVSKLGKYLAEHKDKTKELERFLIGVFQQEDEEATRQGITIDELREQYKAQRTGLSATKINHSRVSTDKRHRSDKEHDHEHDPETGDYKLQSPIQKFQEDVKKQLRTKARTHEERVEEIELLQQEINEIEETVERIRATPEHKSNGSGFLSLKTPEQAHRLVRTLQFRPHYIKRFGGIRIKFSPEFNDVWWQNIGRPPAE